MLNPTVQYSSRDTSHPQSVAVGDFNNDSQMDIVVANFGTDNVGVFLGYGNDIFASQMMYSTGPGSAPNMVAVGDFNKDNRMDIAVANFGTNNIGIHLGNGDGTFKSQTIIQTTP
jgi:predicted nucleotidyltransferase